MKKNLALVFISIIFTFSLFEVYLRYSDYYPWQRTEPGQYKSRPFKKNGWNEPHSIFGWTFNRKHPVHHRSKKNGFDVVYKGNSLGFRDSQFDWVSDIPEVENNIVIFGDSMAFGFGVEEEDRISNQLANLLDDKFKVYNMAAAGWGVDQMMLAFKRYAPEIKMKYAVFAFINDDLQRSVEAYRPLEGKNKLSFKVEDGSLKLRRAGDGGVLGKYFKKLLRLYSVNYFYKYFYKKHLITSLNEKIFEDIIDTGKSLGIKTLFVRIPSKHSFCLKDDWLCESKNYFKNWDINLNSFFKEKNQVYLDKISGWDDETAKEYKKYFFPHDSHINKKAHKVLAETIAEKIKAIE
ncbi:MAG: SGNH/GDSL hydrolase family protein [Nitrospinales bacterium]